MKRFSRKTAVLCAGLTLLGCLAFALGLWVLSHTSVRLQHVRQWHEVQGWKTAQAQLIQGEVAETITPGDDASFSLDLFYRFEINGRSYTGTSLSLSSEPYWRSNNDSAAQHEAEEKLKRLKSQDSLTVHYDPVDPFHCTLELPKSVDHSARVLPALAALFLALGPGLALILLGLGYRLARSRPKAESVPTLREPVQASPWWRLPVFFVHFGGSFFVLSVILGSAPSVVTLGSLIVALVTIRFGGGLISDIERLLVTWSRDPRAR